MTEYKYSIGVHEYGFQNDAPITIYSAGELQAYLDALGLADGDGAIVHVKLNDDNGLWAGGTIPAVSASKALFLSEAKALGFRTLLAWQTGGPTEEQAGPWTDYAQIEHPELLDEFDTAAALIDDIPNVDIFLWGNEREVDDISNTEADEIYRLRYFALEARAGDIWRTAGKLWACGADQSSSNFLGSLDERMAAWEAAGLANPDFLCLHSYGSGGFMFRNVRDVRLSTEYRTGISWSDKLIWSEWAVAFENLTSWNTKSQVRDYRARDFGEHFGRALRRERCYGCAFTFKEVYRPYEGIDPYDGEAPEDTPRFLLQGLIDSLLDSPVNAEPPSADPSQAGLNTRRYLVEGHYMKNAWGAAWQGLKEKARSLVSYFGYWT